MKRRLQTVRTVGTWVVFAFALLMLIFTVTSTLTFNKTSRSLFGVHLFTVMSDSMSKTDFSAGDLIFVRDVDPDTLSEGDIITFTSTSPAAYGETVTHKIRARTTDAAGRPAFVTYGTTTDTDDDAPVTYPYIIGRYVGRLPALGYLFHFLRTPAGYILLILLPFILLIASQVTVAVGAARQTRALAAAERAREKEEVDRLTAELAAAKEKLRRMEEKEEKDPSAPAHNSKNRETVD